MMKLENKMIWKFLAVGFVIQVLVLSPLPIFRYSVIAQEAPADVVLPPDETPTSTDTQALNQEESTPSETQVEDNTGDQTNDGELENSNNGESGIEGEDGENGEDGTPDGVTGDELTEEEEDLLDNASSTESGNTSSTEEGDLGPSGEDGQDGANGENGGSGGSSLPAVIDTGSAAAAANILNMVNLNIVDSEGWVNFLNLFGGLLGDVDLSGITFPENSTCPTNECEAAQLEGRRRYINENDGVIDNNLTVGANTGLNEIDGAGEIYTGDAAAAANVVNVLNTNIVRSNYLVLALNSFGDFAGDLVLPGLSFFEQLFGDQGERRSDQAIPPCDATFEIENENQAEVNNNGETVAESGANEIQDGNGAVIETGDAAALSNTANLVNSNYYNSSPVYILVRVTGRWNGNVFSTPPGLRWEETPMGILITSDNAPSDGNSGAEPEAESAEGGVEEITAEEGGLPFGHGPRPCESSETISNTNNARVNNNVNVFALTGENRIGNGGGSYIGTGDAYAASNVFNVVNTNIVGSNWILALVNIFGDWDGNLAFGRPDLWVGSRAAASTNPLVAGGSVTYTIDVTNHGDATATNVRVRSGSDPHERVKANQTADNLFVTAFNNLFGQDEDNKNVIWEIPSLAPGESKTLTYTSQVTDTPPGGLSSFETITTVSSLETDASDADNTDKLTLMLQGATDGAGSVYVTGFGGGYGRPKLEMTKTSNASGVVRSSSTVSYKIVVKNTFGDIAREAGVVDRVYDPSGNMIEENIWDLGTIYSGEEIVIDYDINFGADAPFGTYVNTAKLYAKNDYNVILDTVEASSSIVIGDVPSVGPSETTEEVSSEEDSSDTYSLSLFKPQIALASPEPLPTIEKAEYREGGLASIFSVFPWLESNCIFLLILIILLAIYVWWRTRRKSDDSK